MPGDRHTEKSRKKGKKEKKKEASAITIICGVGLLFSLLFYTEKAKSGNSVPAYLT